VLFSYFSEKFKLKNKLLSIILALLIAFIIIGPFNIFLTGFIENIYLKSVLEGFLIAFSIYFFLNVMEEKDNILS